MNADPTAQPRFPQRRAARSQSALNERIFAPRNRAAVQAARCVRHIGIIQSQENVKRRSRRVASANAKMAFGRAIVVLTAFGADGIATQRDAISLHKLTSVPQLQAALRFPDDDARIGKRQRQLQTLR